MAIAKELLKQKLFSEDNFYESPREFERWTIHQLNRKKNSQTTVNF